MAEVRMTNRVVNLRYSLSFLSFATLRLSSHRGEVTFDLDEKRAETIHLSLA